MRRGRAHGGVAALIVLAIAASGLVALLFAWLDSTKGAPPVIRIDPQEARILIRIEDKAITSFDLQLARQYHQLRAGKDGFVLPDHGILREAIEHAVSEVILARYNRGIGPDDVAAERARQMRESRDRETMRKIQDLLDAYPGQFEKLNVRPHLASTWIRKLHQTRAIQEEVYQKANAAMKEAVKDPDAFFKSRTADYSLVDSESPPQLPSGPAPPQVGPDHKEQFSKLILQFAKDKLGNTQPGQLCPDVIDAPGEYLVARLKVLTADRAVFEQVSFRKSTFDTWFDAELKKVKVEVVDPETRELLRKNLMNTRYGPWLFPDSK